ncbi:hypothetical protein DFH94DRAFT_427908 [Russula ochroleuca]|uniref:Uncharacterized protein n=1 Tax=Russula ochroleuca TaxID=152965 RepID=A0A9P5MWS7_9AGAM|nr:hypothetical protein DFH94DRAFT_427908 [Russula ochroleuca]
MSPLPALKAAKNKGQLRSTTVSTPRLLMAAITTYISHQSLFLESLIHLTSTCPLFRILHSPGCYFYPPRSRLPRKSPPGTITVCIIGSSAPPCRSFTWFVITFLKRRDRERLVLEIQWICVSHHTQGLRLAGPRLRSCEEKQCRILGHLWCSLPAYFFFYCPTDFPFFSATFHHPSLLPSMLEARKPRRRHIRVSFFPIVTVLYSNA